MTSARFLISPLLDSAGFRHAFFTRNGGVSTGPFRSLSFSRTVGDDPANVSENMARAARDLGVEVERVYFLSQVHGNGVVTIDAGSQQDELLKIEGDALVSADPTVACAIRTADCVPLLLADEKSGAVAAAHAGWRGIVAGVVEGAVASLRALAENDSELIAAVGPHISLEAFEVSQEVADELAAVSPDPGVVDHSFGPKPHVDLRRLVRAKLLALGLSPGSIDDVPGCTMLEPARFFSYRRDGAKSGRHLSAIVGRT